MNGAKVKTTDLGFMFGIYLPSLCLIMLFWLSKALQLEIHTV